MHFPIKSLVAIVVCSAFVLTSCDGAEDVPAPIQGTRIDALASLSQLAPDPSLAQTPPSLPPSEQFPATFGHRVSATVGEGNAFAFGITPRPALVDRTVYAMDARGYLSAHDVLDIDQVLWRSEGVSDADQSAILTGGITVAGGVVFAASGNGRVAAFDTTTGHQLWRQDLNVPVRAAPRVDDGRLFLVTVDSQLFALNTTSGAVLWSARGVSEGSSFLALASPAVVPGGVIAPFASGEMSFFQADTGTPRWSDRVTSGRRMLASSNFGGFGGDPVVVGNALYATSASGLLVAYRVDNGLRVWEQPVASTEAPLVAGNAVFVMASDAHLLAFNRFDGRIFWTTTLPRFEDETNHRGVYHWSSPVLAGGMLYVAGAHGKMHMFHPTTGTASGVMDIPKGVNISPLVHSGRMLLFSTQATLSVLSE